MEEEYYEQEDYYYEEGIHPQEMMKKVRRLIRGMADEMRVFTEESIIPDALTRKPIRSLIRKRLRRRPFEERYSEP